MTHALVNEETLEAMVYERSKAWSSVMKDWSTMDDGMEVDVSEFDDLFKDEDQNPELLDEEEAKEDNVEDAKLELGHINTTTTSVAELTLILCAGKDNETKAEIEEILNQTVPVVEGHKRKWREAGLDRILDTFDEKQIEHHVGRWMRRHNSVYLETTPPKYLHPQDHSISDQSDESLHSIDTARYIQESRRRKAHTTNKNSNMTTIKMYRKHSHKRDELRAKYAYDDEQEHRHHMQALLHRRREKERKLAYLAATPMHCIHSSSHHVRRKHLRKRRANSWMFDSSSSSEDDPSFNGCDCHSCRRHHALSRSAYQYCPYDRGQREYHHRQAASRTMHTMRRHHTFDMDMDLRPRLPENECSCCDSDRLCSNVVHIANSSTEEWVVENRSSPLLLESQGMARKHKQQLVAVRKFSPQSARSKCHEQRLPKMKVASASKLVKKANYVHMFDSDTSDEEKVLYKKRLVNFLERNKGSTSTTPKSTKKTKYVSSTAKKSLKKANAVSSNILPEIKEEQSIQFVDTKKMPPSGEGDGLPIPKISHSQTKSESSDESSQDEIKGRKRLLSFCEANMKSKKASTIMESATKKAQKQVIVVPVLNLPQNNKQEDNSPIKMLPVQKGDEMINPKESHPYIKNEYSKERQAKSKCARNSSAQLESSANKCNPKPVTSIPSCFPQITGKKGSKPVGTEVKKNTKETNTTPLANDKGLINAKKIHSPIEIKSSDESEEEVMQRKRLVSLSVGNLKSKCSGAKKISKQATIHVDNSSSPQVPKQLILVESSSISNPETLNVTNSSSSSHEILNQNPVVSKEKPKKNSENAKIVTKSAATGKTSAAGVKTKTRDSGKKKANTAISPALPQIIEEAPNRSPDSQTKPEPNSSSKVPKTNLKKSGSSNAQDIPKDNIEKACDSEEELKRALALSKASYREENIKRRKTKKQTSNEQPQSPAEQSLAIFNNQSVACNSTALVNDTACKRVLTKKRPVKRAAAVSSTEEQPAANSSRSPTGSSLEEASASSGDPDCTVVTSTTCCEPAASEPIPPPLKLTKRGILLHSYSASDSGNFTLTEQGLGRFIGDRWARKYLKYHIGSRSFDSRHSVYYQPTPQLAAALSAPHNQQTLANISSSSSSDDDIFDQFNRYGTVYSVLEK
uniref:Uncharacterized protein LOC108047548 isoform X1 n=1 Tax=Drosophila rhopaloa TaxID=1041015 RepID=A0A6P4EYM7_DRORH